MTSGCLDRKEVRGAIWGVHSTTDRPASGNTGRLFLAFGGPVCADRISNCPLDRVLTYKNLIYLLNLQIYPVARSILPYHTLIYLPQITVMFTFTTQCRYNTHLFQGPYSQSLYSCSMRFVLKYKFFSYLRIFIFLDKNYSWHKIILF